MALTQLNDKQLMSLFTVTNQNDLSLRGQAILIELVRRGYFFDIQRGDFLMRFDWKLRYGEEPPAPADYIVYLQKHGKQVDRMP